MKKILSYFLYVLLVCAIFRGLYIRTGKQLEKKRDNLTYSSVNAKKSFAAYLKDRDSLFVQEEKLFSEGWDTLAQPRFWQKIMQMTPDSILVNVAATREILFQIPTTNYMDREKKEREAFKDSVREVYNLPEDEEIYVTFGRNHFYKFREVLDSLNLGIQVFKKQGVDPWYAQVILMIESPNQLKASPVGAYGGFQLMRSIAKAYGLKVDDDVDERASLEKSANAAAQFINEVCIPETKAMLDKQRIAYNENDLWFKLMVLHVYHAGAKNVGAVIRKIDPKQGGVGLIKVIWQTQHRRFRNASQNYSQLAIASQLALEQIIAEQYQLDSLKF